MTGVQACALPIWLFNAYQTGNAANTNLKRLQPNYYPARLTIDAHDGGLVYFTASVGSTDTDITDWTSRFKVDNVGNVGIGTSTPSALLSVGATSTQQFLVSNLGVVTDGVWNGTPIGISYGGTNTSTAFTAGSVVFSDGTSLTQDNSNLFWNDSSNRLGIGTSTPAAKLSPTAGPLAVQIQTTVCPSATR